MEDLVRGLVRQWTTIDVDPLAASEIMADHSTDAPSHLEPKPDLEASQILQ